jgi:hypothetical protein
VNCYGKSSGGVISFGLYTVTAQNCTDISANWHGLHAEDIAIGCRGEVDTGIGLFVFIANSCHGVANVSGTAISTSHNVNSF